MFVCSMLATKECTYQLLTANVKVWYFVTFYPCFLIFTGHVE